MTNPRPINRYEVSSIIGRKKRYKLTKIKLSVAVASRQNNNNYFSVIAGTGTYTMYPCLEYAQGRVTSAPRGTYIYTYDSLDKAKAEARRLGTSEARATDIRAVFEVLPVGKMRPNRKLSGVTMCKGVLIGKEVAQITSVATDCPTTLTKEMARFFKR